MQIIRAEHFHRNLPDSLLRAASFTPLSLNFPNAWVGHLPFAAWLIEALNPEIFVELGTHSGNSFFAFCQGVAQSGISTRCYAVDTWKGDEHSGEFEESIFTEISAHQHQHYSKFSRLLRMTFDDARNYFSDRSIALLHIDGLHTYEAVRSDYESWLPKLTPGAVVLFHDTNVRERGFGVWQLWEELKEEHPLHLEFLHSHGLGVLQLNDAPQYARLPWLEPGTADKQKVLDYFTALGARYLNLYDTIEFKDQIASLNRSCSEKDRHIFWQNGQVEQLSRGIADRDIQAGNLTKAMLERDAQISELTQAVARRDRYLTRIMSRLSWRISSRVRSASRALLNGAAKVEEFSLDSTGVLRTPEDRTKKGPASASGAIAQTEWNRANQPEQLHALFDGKWYLQRNPDVRDAGVNPLVHFENDGWKEARNPHPLFDIRWYLGANPDVRAAGVNPWKHFIRSGGAEGRSPHPLFDSAWYLANYPDVRTSGVNPLIHFLQYGWLEERSPSAEFNLPWYLKMYPDVRSSGMNPLIHYAEFGQAEGRPVKPEPAAIVVPPPEFSRRTRINPIRQLIVI